MYVRHLQLGSFRSWERVDLALGPGPTVFVGRNGEGKTNLVEAIDYLSRLSSHRVASDAPLVRAGAEQALLRHPGFSDGRAGDERVRLFAQRVGDRVVVVGASHDEVAEDRTALLLGEAVGLGGALLVGAIGAWLLAGAVVRPVEAD